MSGWARIDADHYDRNEQLKNLISDLEAEILEREMEYSKRKLTLAVRFSSSFFRLNTYFLNVVFILYFSYTSIIDLEEEIYILDSDWFG